MIEAQGLTRRYGAVTAVRGLDLHIEGPGIVGLLGPNGAGKTTILRMLAGTLSPSSGVAKVAGHDLLQAPIEARASVGWLPETPPLHHELTVGEFLRYVAELRGLPWAERLSRVGDVLVQLELTDREGQRIGALSKGLRQRVGLAQALVHDPPVLLLDEPTSGLDPHQIEGVRRLITRLAEAHTVLLSTHVLQEVAALCDRVLVLHKGELTGDGTRQELAQQAGLSDGVELWLSVGPEQATRVLSALDSVSRVAHVGMSEGWQCYRLHGTPDLAPSVVCAAVGQGWSVGRVAAAPVTLEAVFHALTAAA